MSCRSANRWAGRSSGGPRADVQLRLYLYASSVVGPVEGRQAALEFLTGYLVEKSLAVDNVFVFVLVFNYFGVPPIYQHRALLRRPRSVGVSSRVHRRGRGPDAIPPGGHALRGVSLLTGIKLLWSPEQKIEPERNPLIRLFRRVVPMTTDVHGPQFLVKTGGRWHATPLLVALLFMEMSDIIFADSVPAIFALSREPLIVYMSNVFAVLGLRAMLPAGRCDPAIRPAQLRARPDPHIRGAEDDMVERSVRREVSDRMVARHHRCPACRRCRGITGERRAPRMRRRSGAAHESAQASQLAHSCCVRVTIHCLTP